MAPHLQINQRDLSVFVRVQHEDGLDPADPEYSEPQFSGSPAFSEGAAFVGDAVGNREIVVPLFLSAESEADLHQLIRDINQELTRGAVVEYASSASAEVTYFDLERGQLEVDYRYWISRAARTRAVLRLWTRPYGHTGTSRLVAAVVATQSVAQIQVSQVSGDVSAEMNLSVKMASMGAVGGTPMNGYRGGFGVKYPAASGYAPALTDAQLASAAAGFSASLFGASGRAGSQVVGWPLSVTAASRGVARLPLRSQDAGRYRLLALMSADLFGGDATCCLEVSKDSEPLAVLQLDPDPLPFSSEPDMAEYTWRDLGEYAITPSIVDQALDLTYLGNPSCTAGATYPLKIDQLLSLPLDQSAGVISTYETTRNGESWVSQGIGETLGLHLSATGQILRLITRDLRGHGPRLPPIPSGAPSGPAHITVFTTGGTDSWTITMPGANNRLEVSVEVRERFTFLR